MKKRLKYINIVDTYIYDKRLNNTQAMAMGAIYSLSRKNGYCYPTNAFLGDILKCTNRNVSKVLGKLEKLGLIEIKEYFHYRMIVPKGMNCSSNNIEVLDNEGIEPEFNLKINDSNKREYNNKYDSNTENNEISDNEQSEDMDKLLGDIHTSFDNWHNDE